LQADYGPKMAERTIGKRLSEVEVLAAA